MIKSTYFLLILFFSAFGFSQQPLDTLNIEFISDFEREILSETLESHSLDEYFIDILMASDSTIDYNKSQTEKVKIDQYLEGLSKKALKLNEKKRVKFLFEQIHDEFFKKYELDSYFTDIFKNSTYNCVTATALYTYVFDIFKVPYQIKETPTHVYLIAFPKSHMIYVETTIPGKSGSYVPTENMLKKAVDELVELKFITSEQVSRVGYNKAFNDYYYGDENIMKKDLVGIQYYNQAISLLNDKKYENAYWSILKARLFYGNQKARLLSESILFQIVEDLEFERVENFKWFLKLTKASKDLEFLKYKLFKILSQDSWGNYEYDYVEGKLESIEDNFIESELLQSIYSFRADRFSKFQMHKKTLDYAEKIYALNPNDLNAKNYIAESSIMNIAQMNLTEERLMDLKELNAKYPFINEFGVFSRYKIYLYSFLTSTTFDANNALDGLSYLTELEIDERARGWNCV